MLPIAAPLRRVRLTRLSLHSKSQMLSPTRAPTPASSLLGSPKGSITYEVTATTKTKRRRTRIKSTYGPPRMAGLRNSGVRYHPCPLLAAPGGNQHSCHAGHEQIRGVNEAPVPAAGTAGKR